MVKASLELFPKGIIFLEGTHPTPSSLDSRTSGVNGTALLLVGTQACVVPRRVGVTAATPDTQRAKLMGDAQPL